MNNLPILDTEEKLRAYLNKVAGCEVDPLTIKAHIFPDMKTPIRNCWQWQGGEPCLNRRDEPRCTIMEQVTRWNRKNRIRQLKHTIAKLTRMLKNTEQCLLATQKMTGFGCFRPSHWENVFVNKKEEEEKKRLKTLKRLIRKTQTERQAEQP